MSDIKCTKVILEEINVPEAPISKIVILMLCVFQLVTIVMLWACRSGWRPTESQ